MGTRRSIVSITATAVVCVMWCASAGRAQTGIDLLVKPFLGDTSYELDNASGIFYSAGHEAKEAAHFQLNEFDTDGRARFAIPGVADGQKILFLGYDADYLDLASHGALLPNRLVDSSIAVGMPIAKQGDNIWAVSAGVGYAGDNPYAQSSAVYGKGDLLFAHRFGEDQHLVFALDFDGNRSVLPDTPLPGVAYQGKVGDSLEYVGGFPFCSVVWRPFPVHDVTVTVNYAIPDELQAQVGYQPVDNFNFFLGYHQSVDGFHIDDQAYTRRLFFRQQRVEGGVVWTPQKGIELSGAAGYGFDQSFDGGFDVQRLKGVTRVSDEPYLKLNATLRF